MSTIKYDAIQYDTLWLVADTIRYITICSEIIFNHNWTALAQRDTGLWPIGIPIASVRERESE